MRRNTLQDDQHFETDPNGAIRHQRILVEERWETIGADGKPYASEATRDDAIYRHLHSNSALSDSRREIEKMGGVSDVIGEPLTGVRKVVRYETSSTWEAISEIEPLDELHEIANTEPCPHPADRILHHTSVIHDRPLCGRCATYLDEKASA